MIYSYLKVLHVAAVIIFLGNILTGLFWMRFAVKTRDLKIINHTILGIIKSDRLFTIPGVILITTFGFSAAIVGSVPLIRTGWILWSIILFSISGIAFGYKVAPLQKKLLQLTIKPSAENFDWQTFNKEFKSWEIWGLIALVTPVLAFIMMVLKLPK